MCHLGHYHGHYVQAREEKTEEKVELGHKHGHGVQARDEKAELGHKHGHYALVGGFCYYIQSFKGWLINLSLFFLLFI